MEKGRVCGPCASSAFGANVMKQESSPREPCSIEKKVDAKHEVLSKLCFCHEADRRATGSQQEYILEYVQL